MDEIRSEITRLRRRLREGVWKAKHLPKPSIIEGISETWGPLGDNGKDLCRYVPLPDIAAAAARGTVVFYAAEAGTAFPAHFHPKRAEDVYVFGGPVVYDVEGEVTHLADGDCIQVPAGVSHAVDFVGRTLLVIRFAPPYPTDDAGRIVWSAERGGDTPYMSRVVDG